MKDYIRRRVVDIGNHILDSGDTVRRAAQRFAVSKSTVHKDMIERLPLIDGELAGRVAKVLAKNKAERHIRGGEATRRKYESERHR